MTFEEYMKTVGNAIEYLDYSPMRRCNCGDPMCNLMYFDNGFNNTNVPENVIPVDFVSKKKLK